MISSDAFETQVCEVCGMLGYANWCPKCKNGQGIVKLTIPYAAKLLIQEVSERLVCVWFWFWVDFESKSAYGLGLVWRRFRSGYNHDHRLDRALSLCLPIRHLPAVLPIRDAYHPSCRRTTNGLKPRAQTPRRS
jgi:hypothetical protein